MFLPGSGLVSFWEPVHFGNASPFSRDGVHLFFIDVEVCIKMGYSGSYSATHICVIILSSFSFNHHQFFLVVMLLLFQCFPDNVRQYPGVFHVK